MPRRPAPGTRDLAERPHRALTSSPWRDPSDGVQPPNSVTICPRLLQNKFNTQSAYLFSYDFL